MSHFGRKVKRKNRPNLTQASNQLSQALDSLKAIELNGHLADIRPIVKETHQLILTVTEEVRAVALEMAQHRSVLEILTRHNDEARVFLLNRPDAAEALPELELKLAEVK